MLKKFKEQMKNEKGLTLVELLAVIVILAIIAAIAIPSIGGIIEKSRVNAAVGDAQNAIAAANLYFVENQDKGEVEVSVLVTDDFLQDKGTLADAVKIKKVKGGNTISGIATTKSKSTVTFDEATNADLSDKKKYTVAP